MANHQTSSDANRSTVVLPAPTAWPFLLAAGVSLLFTSLVTNVVVAYLGIVLLVISAIGWFRQVLPHDQHEAIEVVPAPMEIVSTRTRVARIHVDETHRAQLPLATYPISSGIIGGLAGGVAMIIPAGLYGLLGSIVSGTPSTCLAVWALLAGTIQRRLKSHNFTSPPF